MDDDLLEAKGGAELGTASQVVRVLFVDLHWRAHGCFLKGVDGDVVGVGLGDWDGSRVCKADVRRVDV